MNTGTAVLMLTIGALMLTAGYFYLLMEDQAANTKISNASANAPSIYQIPGLPLASSLSSGYSGVK